MVVPSGVLLFYLFIRGFYRIFCIYASYNLRIYSVVLCTSTILVLWQNPVAGSCKAEYSAGSTVAPLRFLFFLRFFLSLLLLHVIFSLSSELALLTYRIYIYFSACTPASPLFSPLSASSATYNCQRQSPSAYSWSACSVTQDFGGVFQTLPGSS